MSKQSSAPIDDFLSRSFARCRRSRRRRSKSMRCSQSTAMVPWVLSAIISSWLLALSLTRGRDAPGTPALLLTHFSCGFGYGSFRWDCYIFQRRRERDRDVHRAHAFYRGVEVVECAFGDDGG